MRLEMELWHLMLLLLAFFGCVGGFGKILLDQVEKRLAEKALAQDEARNQGQRDLHNIFAEHLAAEKAVYAKVADHSERISRLEEAVRRMPSHDDFKSIHARLDTLATKTDTMQGQIPGLVDNVRLILNILKRD